MMIKNKQRMSPQLIVDEKNTFWMRRGFFEHTGILFFQTPTQNGDSLSSPRRPDVVRLDVNDEGFYPSTGRFVFWNDFICGISTVLNNFFAFHGRLRPYRSLGWLVVFLCWSFPIRQLKWIDVVWQVNLSWWT